MQDVPMTLGQTRGGNIIVNSTNTRNKQVLLLRWRKTASFLMTVILCSAWGWGVWVLREGEGCLSPKASCCIFTSVAVHNIDNNPSPTTFKDSFHGTAISPFQHPRFVTGGNDGGLVIPGGPTGLKTVQQLPSFYADIPPVISFTFPWYPSDIKAISVSTTGYLMPNDGDLNTAIKMRTDDLIMLVPAFHASCLPSKDYLITRTALLPRNAHTATMIRHSMNMVRCVAKRVNAEQIPVIAFDQPPFAIAKQVQRKWPGQYGEQRLVIIFGVLLKTLGDWPQGSGPPRPCYRQRLLPVELPSPSASSPCWENMKSTPSNSGCFIFAAAQGLSELLWGSFWALGKP